MNFPTHKIQDIYEFSHYVSEGAIDSLFHGYDTVKHRPVMIRVLKEDTISKRPEDIIRFHTELGTLSGHNHPAFQNIYSSGEAPLRKADTRLSHFIVTEHVEGMTLHDILSSGQPPEMREIIQLMCHITQALIYLHKAGIYHREICPANIFIPRSPNGHHFKYAKLTNFSIAHVREYSNINDSNEIKAVFNYMSPEQSGMVKRIVDERSDLYCLGTVLYHLLTGTAPFNGDTIAAIVHQHVAKTPLAPQTLSRTISRTLSDIVLKLLEKEPENRYQSAQGLLSDLEKYQRGQSDFMLGLNDTHVKLSFRTTLVGRGNELKRLKDIFNHSRQGQGSMCFIKGEAGRGKTRLTDELERYVLAQKGMMIHAKSYTGETKIPYGAFEEVLDGYLKLFNSYTSDRQKKIKASLTAACGNFGQIIIQLNPKAECLLGQCPPLVDLEPEREKDRFMTTLSKFFRTLSSHENGLVIVIDDLQWCDDGSLDLLRELLHDISDSALLVLATYRDNEVDLNHNVGQLTDYASKNGLPLSEIYLDLFTQEQMRQFVAGLFFETIEHTLSIADFIFEKSKGNPFFAIELLKQFLNEKTLYYHDNRWEMNPELIKQTDITQTIIDVLIKRLKWLDEREYQTLTFAAVIGKNFSISMLFELLSITQKDVVNSIDHALQLQLIEENPSDKGNVFFVHERIKQALYQSIGDEKRREMHLKVARAKERHNLEQTNVLIFELAHHYIEGEQTDKILEYAYKAGIAARNSHANDDALQYFNSMLHHLEQLPEKDLEKRLELWMTCKQHIGEIHITIGNSDQAIAIYDELLTFKTDPIDIALIYKQLCNIYYIKGDFDRCEAYGRMGLDLLGERLPANKIYVIFRIFKELFVRLLHSVYPNRFLNRPLHPNHRKNEIIAQFRLPLIKMYMWSDKLKFVSNILRALNFNESRFGKSRHLGRAMGGYGYFLFSIGLFKPAFKYLTKGHKMRMDTHDEWGVAQSHQWLSYYYEGIGDYTNALKHATVALEKFEYIGDNAEIGITLNGIYINKSSIGNFSGIRSLIERYTRVANKSGDPWQISIAKQFSGLDACITNDLERALLELLEAHHISYEHKQWHVHCLCCIYLGWYYILVKDAPTAISYLEKARQLHEEHHFLKQYMSPLYAWLTKAYIDDFYASPQLSGTNRKKYIKKIKRISKKALQESKLWIAHKGLALRFEGEYYALIGNAKKAERFFLKSIDIFSRQGLKPLLAAILYEYGLFLDRIGRTAEAKKKYQSSYKICSDIGFLFYLPLIKEKLGIAEETTAMERLMDRQRLTSVMRVSQDISSILNLTELLDQVMEKAIEVTGAQRGYLFIADDTGEGMKLFASKSIIASAADQYSKAIVTSVFRHHNPIRISDATSSDTRNRFPDISSDYKSILCIPIKRQTQIIGVCYLDNPLTTDVFSEEDIEILNALMTQSAISIENARLFEDIAAKENTLRASEEKYRLILDNIEDAYIEVDLNGNFTFFNDAACKIYGYPEHEIRRTNYQSLVIEEDLSRAYDIFNSVYETGNAVKDFEHTIIQKDGKTVSIEVSVSPIKTTTGDIIGLRGIARDISKRKESEALRIARDVAEKANHAKSEFLANMSHEIRTPMNAILGFSSLLKDRVTEETSKHFLDAVLSSGKTLMTLINDILDLSKIEAGKLIIQREAVRPVVILREIQQIFSQKAAEKNIELILDIAEGLPEHIMIDEIRLRQILLNIVGNAVKFVDQGHVKISLNGTHTPADNTIDLYLSITDTGIGIPAGQLESIFESFTQQEGQSNAKYGGTGLGLSITQKLTQMMGGTITVKSEVGRGSTFQVNFPSVEIAAEMLSSTPSENRQAAKFIESIQFQPATILVADDTPQNRLLIKSYFSGQSITIIEAENGRDVLEKAHEHKPDLIFMDLKMPELNGYAATGQLKSHDTLKSIPIIAVTASVADYENDMFKNAGCEAIIRKPVSKETIIKESMNYLAHTTSQSPQNGNHANTLTDAPRASDAHKRLPELNRILTGKITDHWETIKEGFDFDEIEVFAEHIIELGTEYHAQPLTEWGEEVLFHTANFDTKQVPKSMLKFPEIITACKKLRHS